MKTSVRVKIKSILLISCSFMTVLFYQNCSKPVSQSSSLVDGLTDQDIATQKALYILTTKCSSCHNSESPTGGVDVTTLDQMLASGAVVPTEPGLSPLFQAISEGSMPPSRALAQDDILAVSDWIAKMGKDTPVNLPPDTPIPLGPNFASINRNILRPKCLSCHNSSNSRGGVSFSSYASASNTVQRGSPAGSSLYTSITRTTNTMPQGGANLSSEEKTAISGWITSGGNND